MLFGKQINQKKLGFCGTYDNKSKASASKRQPCNAYIFLPRVANTLCNLGRKLCNGVKIKSGRPILKTCKSSVPDRGCLLLKSKHKTFYCRLIVFVQITSSWQSYFFPSASSKVTLRITDTPVSKGAFLYANPMWYYRYPHLRGRWTQQGGV